MAHHPWRTILDDERALVRWCPFCGALRTDPKQPEGAHVAVLFPVAHERVGRTTCARAQDEQAREE